MKQKATKKLKERHLYGVAQEEITVKFGQIVIVADVCRSRKVKYFEDFLCKRCGLCLDKYFALACGDGG